MRLAASALLALGLVGLMSCKNGKNGDDDESSTFSYDQTTSSDTCIFRWDVPAPDYLDGEVNVKSVVFSFDFRNTSNAPRVVSVKAPETMRLTADGEVDGSTWSVTYGSGDYIDSNPVGAWYLEVVTRAVEPLTCDDISNVRLQIEGTYYTTH